MIRSFRGDFARSILRDRKLPKGFPERIAQVARRKLVQLDNAAVLSDLAAPPGNRLEALKGKLSDRHSIRINDQWRILFRSTRDGPEEVEIVDYH
ncbi:MAG: type II toxin-antitoxin system RelE/ParE family toxin [Hyphomicrobiales bacterium]